MERIIETPPPMLIRGWARAPRGRARRGRRFIRGVEDELRSVFKRKSDAHFLTGRDRNDSDNALAERSLELVVTREITIRPMLRERSLKMRLRER